jgi:hypothetical protein
VEQSATREAARDGEDEGERLDRELIELLNELRVAMPGVQVLFGFLLTVPFQQRFTEISAFQKDVYFVTLLLAALASALLIAPSAQHRLLFRERAKPYLVRAGTRMALGGLACLALAMCSAVLLVTDLIFASHTAAITAAFAGAVYLYLWFGHGLIRRMRGLESW